MCTKHYILSFLRNAGQWKLPVKVWNGQVEIFGFLCVDFVCNDEKIEIRNPLPVIFNQPCRKVIMNDLSSMPVSIYWGYIIRVSHMSDHWSELGKMQGRQSVFYLVRGKILILNAGSCIWTRGIVRNFKVHTQH